MNDTSLQSGVPLTGHTAHVVKAEAAPGNGQAQWILRLDDGSSALVRSLHKSDAPLERAFLEDLSSRSKRFRFMGQFTSPSERLLDALTNVDGERHVALAAFVHIDGAKREIGVARYACADGSRAGEFAVVVADEWQRRGLGTLLTRLLIDEARRNGLQELFSIDAVDNSDMRDLAVQLGFNRSPDPLDATQVVHRIRL